MNELRFKFLKWKAKTKKNYKKFWWFYKEWLIWCKVSDNEFEKNKINLKDFEKC